MLTAFAFYALVSLTSCAQQTTMPKHKVYCRLPLNSDAAKWIKHIKFMVLNGRRPGHAGLFTQTVQACSLEHVVYQGMLR